MGVLAEIAQRVLRTPNGRFAYTTHGERNSGRSHAAKDLRILQSGGCSVEAEFVLCMQRFQAVHELAPEYFFENTNRQEETLLRVDPPGVVRSQAAGWNHTVDVRMMLEFLVPGVQNAEETDLGAEALR